MPSLVLFCVVNLVSGESVPSNVEPISFRHFPEVTSDWEHSGIFQLSLTAVPANFSGSIPGPGDKFLTPRVCFCHVFFSRRKSNGTAFVKYLSAEEVSRSIRGLFLVSLAKFILSRQPFSLIKGMYYLWWFDVMESHGRNRNRRIFSMRYLLVYSLADKFVFLRRGLCPRPRWPLCREGY